MVRYDFFSAAPNPAPGFQGSAAVEKATGRPREMAQDTRVAISSEISSSCRLRRSLSWHSSIRFEGQSQPLRSSASTSNSGSTHESGVPTTHGWHSPVSESIAVGILRIHHSYLSTPYSVVRSSSGGPNFAR